VSKLINNGLLLVGQGAYQDLASPQQASVEQYNIIRFLGGAAPYIQNKGFGISTDIPDQCTLEQVQLFSRHGERYPSTGSGKKYKAVYEKLMSYNGTFKGELAFLNDDYEYFVPDSVYLEKETSPKNSDSIYAGTTDAMKHGIAFRTKYGELFDTNDTLPVFTSNSGRVYQTSQYFARGFMGDDFSNDTVKTNIISEDADMGANSLTPRDGCFNYNENANTAIVDEYTTEYLTKALNRFKASNPGLNITEDDVSNLFGYCAYELNVKGASPMCDIFTNEEFIQYSYSVDLDDYYSNSAGNNMTRVIGSTLLNASLELLNHDKNENKIWLSFTHDTDIEIFHSAIGILIPDEDLPVDYTPFPSPYSHVGITPQGARTIIEKYACGNESYVRYVINDAVIPIKKCSSGPGFSCNLNDYNDYVAERVAGTNYVEQCGNNNASAVTFYWDYETTNYTASLINS
nr:Chain A, phytase [Debaryomyces castellii]2GFI_B Chain B, phytase [Debaryomyces castellii]